MGMIDACPDQSYLAKKLLPVYAPCLTDPEKNLELETVPAEAALAEPCPTPDWNYLRWDGYSDQKYRAIQHGEGLLNLPWHGGTVPVDVKVSSYYSNGNLALSLQNWTHGEPEPWGNLTVNLGILMGQDCAFVDVNNFGNEILPWIEKNGIAVPTGRTRLSGMVFYPEYRFHGEKLAELDSVGYQRYLDNHQNQSLGMSMT